MTPDSIATLYGVKLNHKNDPKQHRNWDGKQINCLGLEDDLILHEISHYIVASPERRQIVDYGLGFGPNADRYSPTIDSFKIVDFNEGNQEEIVTCTIESILAALCGIHPIKLLNKRRFIRSTLKDWTIKEDYYTSIEHLLSKGFIGKSWFPTQLQPAATLQSWARMTNFKKGLKKVT